MVLAVPFGVEAGDEVGEGIVRGRVGVEVFAAASVHCGGTVVGVGVCEVVLIGEGLGVSMEFATTFLTALIACAAIEGAALGVVSSW